MRKPYVQRDLFAHRAARPTQARRDFAAANLLAATIIASDPAAYPAGCLSALWADMVLSRAAERDDAEAWPRFAWRAA